MSDFIFALVTVIAAVSPSQAFMILEQAKYWIVVLIRSIRTVRFCFGYEDGKVESALVVRGDRFTLGAGFAWA